jgi:hypothetical protein
LADGTVDALGQEVGMPLMARVLRRFLGTPAHFIATMARW